MMREFDIARSCSEYSDFYKCKTGCVAIYKGHVIAKGFNTSKTSPLQAKYNFMCRDFDGHQSPASLHAEMMMISKIRYLDIDFRQVKVFIWRGKETPMLSKPCKACEKAMRDLGIRKVYYTSNNSFIKELYNDDISNN